MEKFFDKFSQIVAGSLSRRDVMKWTGVTVGSAALVGLGLREAEAVDPCRDFACAICHTIDDCLGTNPGCSCIPKVKNGVQKRCFCHGVQSCAGLIPCNTTGECKAALGRGFKCALSCCAGALCIPKCSLGLNAAAVALARERRGLTTAG